MANWSCLPMEMREEVAKRLDFRTRFRFRHVSKSSQRLIDTLPLFIPQVVICAPTASEARLTFYLGIEKWIDVEFSENRQGKVVVRVSETSLGKVRKRGKPRHIDFGGAPLLALTAFRNATMNRKTVCGGVDISNTGEMQFASAREGHEFFRHRLLRTKIFAHNFYVCSELLLHFSADVVEELHILNNGVGAEVVANLPAAIVHTNRMKVRVDSDADVPKAHTGWYQLYTVTEEEDISQLFPPEEFEAYLHHDRSIIHGPNDIAVFNFMSFGYSYLRVNPCGILIRNTDVDLRNEDSAGCEMRRACPRCADPFEHWYLKRTMKAYRVAPNDAQAQMIRFGMKPTYKEYLVPIVNDDSSLNAVLHMTRLEYYKTNADGLEDFEELREIIAEAKATNIEKNSEKEDVEEPHGHCQSRRAIAEKKAQEHNRRVVYAFGALVLALIVHSMLF